MPKDARSKKLADLFSKEIDKPTSEKYSNPSYSGDPDFKEFSGVLENILGKRFHGAGAYNPQEFGETQNPPQYRGIRMLLPQSGADYEVLNENRIPGYEGLQQELLGHLITRGYPVLGGTGQMQGFAKGFNPVGFGQR